MPRAAEFRFFVGDGKPLLCAPYWEHETAAEPEPPPLDLFGDVATRVQSRFFTMDVARRADDGSWLIVELGDGQVAGLPPSVDPSIFYDAPAGRFKK